VEHGGEQVHANDERSLVCVECGAEADEDADGWGMYRADLPEEDDEPELAAYCPGCVAREFDDEREGAGPSRQPPH
jgi:hypothetical protein